MDGSNAARDEFVRGHGGECGNEGARPRRLRDSVSVNSGQRSGPVKQREGLRADGPLFDFAGFARPLRKKFHSGVSAQGRSFIPPSKPKEVLHVRREVPWNPLVRRRNIPSGEHRRGLKRGRFRLRAWCPMTDAASAVLARSGSQGSDQLTEDDAP